MQKIIDSAHHNMLFKKNRENREGVLLFTTTTINKTGTLGKYRQASDKHFFLLSKRNIHRIFLMK